MTNICAAERQLQVELGKANTNEGETRNYVGECKAIIL